jgi:hypothetical protein
MTTGTFQDDLLALPRKQQIAQIQAAAAECGGALLDDEQVAWALDFYAELVTDRPDPPSRAPRRTPRRVRTWVLSPA